MKEVLSFYDEESEILSKEIPDSASSNIKLSFELDFDLGQSYVTSKIIDRHGITRKLNIQAGLRGIKLQNDLFRIKGNNKEYTNNINNKNDLGSGSPTSGGGGGGNLPPFVYVKTCLLKDSKILIRKLPVIGTSDWLLIFEEDLFLLAARGMYDEIEILG
ncbi:MAG: hypothetical protein ACTHKF_01285 [Candidatus Nitrosocosmicus sp.]